MHTGYCISCYGEESCLFSAPISAKRYDLQKVLAREFLINGEPLTQDEVIALRSYTIGEIEIGWGQNLSFYLEGYNLPDTVEEWT